MLIALEAQECWSLHHLDVKSAFLNGEIKEEIYVTQPEGYMKEKKRRVGAQAQQSSLWTQESTNAKLYDTLKSIGFVKSKNDQGVYYLNST